MKVKLVKRMKIWHEAGDIVEVSPADADFLLSVQAAEKVAEKKKETKKK